MAYARHILFLNPQNAAVGGNSAPVLSASSMTFNEDTPTTLTLSYSDADSDAANWATLTQIGTPANITLELNTPGNGQIRVTPASNWNGTTSFTVTVEDSQGNTSNQLTVSVTVTAVNDSPVLTTDSFSTNEDTNYDLDVSALYTDPESNAANWATLEATVSPGKGALQLNTPGNGSIRYVSTANQNGADTFSIRVQDSVGAWSNVAEITVTINAVADNPVLASMSLTTNEDTDGTIDVDTYYSSPDGTARRTTSGSIVTTTPSNGSISINQSTGVITYTPDTNWNGSDSFDVYVFDANNLQSNTQTVAVTVTAVSDAPIAYNLASDTFENNAVVFALSALSLAADIDGTIDWTTVEIGTDATYGSTSVNGTTGDITYTPDTNSTTSDSFTWRVQDSSGTWSNYATISIDILQSYLAQTILDLVPYDYRRLNETSSTFADSSGNSRTAAAKAGGGTIGYNAQTAPDGSPAVAITDATQYIDITDTNSRNVFGGTTWSVLFFFRGNSGISWTSVGRALWQFREASPTNNQFLQQVLVTTAQFQSYMVSQTVTDTNNPTTITGDSVWRMGAVAFNQPGNAIAYYLDGAADGTDTGVGTPSLTGTLSLRIGNSSGSAIDVALSHWALFNRVITAAEVARVYDPPIYEYATLRYLGAANGTQIGVAIGNAYDSESSAFKAVATSDFTVWATENAIKYSTLYFSGIGSPNWTPFDQLMTAAHAAGITVNFHPLFWHSDNSYIDNEIDDTVAAAQAEITRRIQALKDRIDANGWNDPQIIEVCNEILVTSQTEAVTNGRPLRQDHQWSYKFNDSGTTGTQTSSRAWIEYAFIEAHRIFPNSKLVIAEFRGEKAGHWKGDALYDLVDSLNDAGIPIDGVHMQAHWEHFVASEWLPDSSIVTQVNRFKALTNYRGVPMHVGYSETDIHMTSATNPVSRNASASSTGTTMVADGNIFLSEMVGWKVYNMTDGTSTTISAYTSATTVTVSDTIGDTWDGDDIMIAIDITGTVSASSSGTTLITTAATFNSNMAGWLVYNITQNEVRVISSYSSTTQVTVDASIGDTWDGDTILLGQDAVWYYLAYHVGGLLDYFGMWNIDDANNANGDSGNSTLRDLNTEKKRAWTLFARGLYDA